jgi:hypothetical protein
MAKHIGYRCFKFRGPDQVPLNDLYLMELAHLHLVIRKGLLPVLIQQITIQRVHAGGIKPL